MTAAKRRRFSNYIRYTFILRGMRVGRYRYTYLYRTISSRLHYISGNRWRLYFNTMSETCSCTIVSYALCWLRTEIPGGGEEGGDDDDDDLDCRKMTSRRTPETAGTGTLNLPSGRCTRVTCRRSGPLIIYVTRSTAVALRPLNAFKRPFRVFSRAIDTAVAYTPGTI